MTDPTTHTARPLPADVAGLVERIEEPSGLGAFVGDIWFGHPVKRTMGTHKWDGSAWVALPSEVEALMGLLAEVRAELDQMIDIAADWRSRAEKAEAENARLLSILDSVPAKHLTMEQCEEIGRIRSAMKGK